MEQQLPSLEMKVTFEGLESSDFSRLAENAQRVLKALATMKDELPPTESTIEDEILHDMFAVLTKLKAAKPNERSDKARRYAICITEFEKVISCYYAMIGLELFGESEGN